MSKKSVRCKKRAEPEFVTADVETLHDHSYATGDADTDTVSLRAELKHLKETCQLILDNQFQIMKDIAIVKNESNINNESDSGATNDVTELPKLLKPVNKQLVIKLPCSSVEDLENLDKKVLENVYYENYMVNHFKNIQDYELPKFVRSAFQSIMTEEVARSFSWFGLNHNRCIKDFKLISILLDLINQKFTYAPKETTINFMRKYFVTCKDKSRKQANRLIRNQRNSNTEPN